MQNSQSFLYFGDVAEGEEQDRRWARALPHSRTREGSAILPRNLGSFPPRLQGVLQLTTSGVRFLKRHRSTANGFLVACVMVARARTRLRFARGAGGSCFASIRLLYDSFLRTCGFTTCCRASIGASRRSLETIRAIRGRRSPRHPCRVFSVAGRVVSCPGERAAALSSLPHALRSILSSVCLD